MHQYEKLAESCIQNFIKLIEELSKVSIIPIELKRIFSLLREESGFPQSKQLLQTLVVCSLQSLSNSNICAQFFTISAPREGITVPDIKNWSMSGSYGFIFHILVRLQESTDVFSKKGGKLAEEETKKESERPNCRRMLLK